MKRLIALIMFACLFVYPALASYTYEVYSYGPSKILYNNESILVDQMGGMSDLTLTQHSTAEVLGTSVLGQSTGGIWYLTLGGDSCLEYTGGQTHQLTMNIDATALLSGGLIETLWSYQIAWEDDGSGGLINTPHITIDCLDWSHDTSTNILTGHWLDGTSFNIKLYDVTGYSPAIDNIQFIPEPVTVLLMGIGGLLIRKKK